MSEEKVWTKADTDRMLDLHFVGRGISEIGKKMGCQNGEILRRIGRFIRNDKNRAEEYIPGPRLSRKGKAWTHNEEHLLKIHGEEKVNVESTACVLARSVDEILQKRKSSNPVVSDLKVLRVSTDVDLLLAYRYLYYVQNISIISDVDYDAMEQEAIEFAAGGKVLKTPGSDRPEDYPPHIRGLAIYLAFKSYKPEGGK